MHPRDRLQSLLNGVRRRWRAHAALRALGRAALAASVPLLAAVALSMLLDPAGRALAVLTVVMSVMALAAAAVIVWRSVRRPTDYQLARFVEERVVDLVRESTVTGRENDLEPLNDVLVSAIEDRDQSQTSVEGFRPLVVETAARRLEAIGSIRIVPLRTIARGAAEAVTGAVVLAVSLALAWPVLGLASEAAWISLFPGSVEIAVLPGDVRVPAGSSLTIRASVRTRDKILSRSNPSLTVAAGAEERTVPMTSGDGVFQFSFESVDRTFRYRVAAGSARSQEYTVMALHAPRVERIDLRYDYPAFTGQPPREETGAGDIYAPEGTKVRVRVHTDKPIQAGELALTGTKLTPLQPTADRVLETQLVLSTDDSYRIGLIDRDGLRSSGDTEYFIRVMDDRPPDVRILRPAGDQQITPLEEVAIEARADDDHGIAKFELVYAVAGREPRVVAFTASAGRGSARVGNHVLAAEELRVQPGDVISYYARARDIGRGKRPTETRSDMFFLEVRPFTEEFVSAQSQGTAGMSGDQIETLIAAQKEIISATWNIERRASAGAGRSPADIMAIAEAQSELKGRAEQIASRAGRSRGAFPAPQQLGPPRQLRTGRPAGDPVGSAISAMGRALDQLNGQRAGEALAHEMAALQGLLQAQAEIRRREVAQQAGTSAGAMGRQGQDLSALFDKELQRQQRTNYESRSQVEERQEPEGDTARDRIRELARRQEELGRKQRELADAGLPAEERKRQLETLTREQNRLREQAEEFARQMAQQGGRSGENGGQRGGSSTADESRKSEMRGASEQMRNAASELQRDDPAAAAGRAEQAASRLRRLEQQLGGDSDESRERAAGELGLEARQIAGEQQRIAGEAARLEKGPESGNRDAWRRLASEKDKLADRVDALERSAERLAEAQKGSKRGATEQAALAARELEQQRISGRMRETAKGMRGTPQRGAAATEHQIARALDRVVDRLGGGADAAEDLSRELGRSQALRDRLDTLERQMREAEAKESAGRQAGSSSTNGDLRRLRDEYATELQRARETLSRLERSAPGAGLGGTTPEAHEWSVTDQGTEGFKQDFAEWESLRRDVNSALERYEASIIARATRKSMQDRLSGGGSDHVPDAYRELIARYYESLARKK
jgi:hypothetical protein